MKKIFFAILISLFICNSVVLAEDNETIYSEGYLEYTIQNGSITIVGYFGDEDTIIIPNSIAGTPVNTIAKGAFADATASTIKLPDTITTIEEGSFSSSVNVVYASNTTNEEDDPTNDTPTNNNQPAANNQSTIVKQENTTNSKDSSTTKTENNNTNAQEVTISSDDVSEVYFDEAEVTLDEDEIEETAEIQTTEAKSLNPYVLVGCSIVAVASIFVMVFVIRKMK